MRTTMPIQNEILRLKGLKHNKTRVAKLLGINRETVIKYWDGPVTDLYPSQFKFQVGPSRPV